jgi:hypothetical protein
MPVAVRRGTDLGIFFSSVQFPGAVNSKFTTQMSFLKASDLPAIPTYRVMDSNGELVDGTRRPPDVTDEEVLTWYKNMLTGEWLTGVSGEPVADQRHSEHHGCGHVRGTTARSIELLHGTITQTDV